MVSTWQILGPGDAGLVPDPSLEAARAAVASAALVGEAQERTRADVLRFLDEHPDALHRSCSPGHLTGSALVLEPVSERVLVLFHRKAQRWLQPGGHADGDGALAHVAWREATEETGLDGLRVVTPAVHLDVHEVHFAGDAPHLHLDVRYLVLAPAGVEAAPNDESEALRWVAPTELDDVGADVGTLELARRSVAVADELASTGRLTPGR